jgi:hypothetical protein
MQENQHSLETGVTSPDKGLLLLILFAIPLLFGLCSVALGRDVNWDLKNYHYYNAYAFLHHRLDVDVVPAQEQTFINPIADIPFYLLARHFPSWVAGFALGFLHGYNVSLILLIFWSITSLSGHPRRLVVGVLVAVVSALAPGFVSELGNTMNDNLTSLFVLAALLLIIESSKKAQMPGDRWRSLVLLGSGGLIMGLGVGLKPTNSVFALASLAAFVVWHRSWSDTLTRFSLYAIAGVFGGLISSGFWWWELWSRYGNPFLPFYNDIFKSPFMAPLSFVDQGFLPQHVWEYFVWPIVFELDGLRVNQWPFSDIRFILFYLLLLVWAGRITQQKLGTAARSAAEPYKDLFDRKSGNFLLLFFAISFISWMVQSSIYRYIIVLELLVPICLLIVVDRLVESRRTILGIAVTAGLLVLLFFRPFNWGRLEWRDEYFSVDTTRYSGSQNALVVMLGESPTAYVIPEFPPSYRFVRPENNFMSHEEREGFSTDGFLVEIKQLVQRHHGKMYVLYNSLETNIDPEKSLSRLGLENAQIIGCALLKINTRDKLKMCEVRK